LKALRNILSDLSFQFRLRGGLFTRISCVAGYYRHYGWARLQGHDRDESQNRAWLRLAEDGFMRKTVQLHWPPGMIMELDAVTASVIVREMVAERMYALLPEFVPEAGQTVVDVGGHQGTFTLPAAARVGASGRVIAVEALPANRERLERNVSRNGLKQVTIVGAAASDAAGEASLAVLGDGTCGSLVIKPAGAREIAVRMDTLDHILELAGAPKPALIKIDVEGACLSVLKGAAKTLESRPRLVMEVELGPAEIEKVVSFLEQRGYACRKFDNIIYAS
jgi:FkbM family methyltransferase